MEPLPLPPPPPGAILARPERPARPGQVTIGWRVVFILGWGGVLLGLGAVVKSSRTMGLSTWWLGPSADPNNIAIEALPFAVAVVMVVLGFRNVRHLPYFGLLGAIALAAIATGDVGRFDALAQVELVTAGIGLFVSIAAFAGLLRPVIDGPAAEAALEAGLAAHPAHPVPPPFDHAPQPSQPVSTAEPVSKAEQPSSPAEPGQSAPPSQPAEPASGSH